MGRPASIWFWKGRGYATETGGRRRLLVRCSRPSKSHRELAQQQLAEVLKTIVPGLRRDTAGVSRLDQVIDLFLADCKLRVDGGEMKPNTVKLFYRKFLSRVRKDIGQVRLSHLTRERLLAFRGQLTERKLKPNSIRNYLSCLRTCLAWARSQGIAVPGDITVMKIPGRQRRMQIPTNEQIEQLIAAAARPVADVLEVLFSVATRPGDLYALKWADVDLDRGELILWDSKTGRRIAFLSNRAETVLRRRLAERQADTEFVFCNSRGGRWKIDSFAEHVRVIRRKLQLPEFVSAYIVRHCYTTNCFVRGLDVATIRNLRGDATVTTTIWYEHLSRHVTHLKLAARRAAEVRAPDGGG